MNKLSSLVILIALSFSCQNAIKNPDAQVVVEEGTNFKQKEETVAEPERIEPHDPKNPIIGYWVGDFKPDIVEDKSIYVDDAFAWDRTNKINISIDKITDSVVIGHSVVAGNERPFKGSVKEKTDTSLNLNYQYFEVKEPGNNKYDGKFTFVIINGKLSGKWKAYKDIDIQNRKYTLTKSSFTYNLNVLLSDDEQPYVDWRKSKTNKDTIEFDDGEKEEWIWREFATSTQLIYSMNASNTLFSKKDVENLKKGDLKIIRNTIYARHGYSFKNRALRVFFEAQDWYIPVYADIKTNLTEIEKQNIKLLLSYEKNAEEYYDSFGRG